MVWLRNFIFLIVNLSSLYLYRVFYIFMIKIDRAYASSSYPGDITIDDKYGYLLYYPLGLLFGLCLMCLIYNMILLYNNYPPLPVLKFYVPLVLIELVVFLIILYNDLFLQFEFIFGP